MNGVLDGEPDGKRGHVRVSERPLAAIRPSPENEALYRPVSPDDPDVRALAQSIRDFGLKEPLVVSADGFLLSGHRRHVACRLAGLNRVPCRVEPIRRGHPDFVRLLREYNRQRVKTRDEVTREEIVSSDPEEAYRALREHREAASRVDAVATIRLGDAKGRHGISKAKEPFLKAVLGIIDGWRAYWPLTDRRIHYALLNDPPLVHASKPHSRYQNTLQCYKATCDLVTRARLAGRIPWAAVHDPTRPVCTWRVHGGVGDFTRDELGRFLKNYYRDLQQSQPNHIEVVGEKNTVEGVIRPVASRYCVPTTIGRGYCSLPPRYEMAQRFRKSGKEKLVLLVLSDFDPEGEDIAHSFARSMRDDFGVKNIVAAKVALTASQVRAMALPPAMKAKATSSRAKKFTERHGHDVFELEAVPPERLQGLLDEAIRGVLDVDAYNAEVDAEKQDAAHLDGVRRRIKEFISHEAA